MNCRETTEFLLEYLSGDLATPQRAVFDAHLAVCPDCRNYLDSYRKTVALSRAAFAEPAAAVDSSIPESLVKAILAARTAS